MRKNIIFIIFAAVILLAAAACSGYLNNQNSADIKGGEFLALADGSGFLSSDNYNEITPFLYNYPVDGKTYLFFSSDRGGNYDIYYTEMLSNSTFKTPVQLNNVVNTSSNEISPALCFANGQYYLTFIRIAGTSTNVMAYSFTGTFSSFTINQTMTTQALQLTIIPAFGSPSLYLANGTSSIQKYTPATGGPLWVSPSSIATQNPVKSLSGYSAGNGTNVYLFGLMNNQFQGCYQTSTTNIYINIGEYTSPYHDDYPFIETNTYKVYFASDRYGKGNYDLYRYNKNTYDMVTGFPKVQ